MTTRSWIQRLFNRKAYTIRKTPHRVRLAVESLEDRTVPSADFLPAASVPVDVEDLPFNVAVGDFDADGNADLAVANARGDDVSVVLGDGAGGFGDADEYTVGDGPVSVAVGYFNEDTHQDLAVAYSVDDTVRVLLGDEDGNFVEGGTFSVGNSPHSVAVGDFNGDTHQDLAVANLDDDTVSVLMGDGEGGFGGRNDYAVEDSPFNVAVGDFDKDGYADLAVANALSDTVSVLLSDGEGGFGAATSFAVGDGPNSVAVGDFDADGNQDLAVANSDTVSVLLGDADGNGGFSAATSFAIGGRPFFVAVADFDLDGNQDLAVVQTESGTVSVVLGDGNGGFGTTTSFDVGDWPSSVAVADFNGDTHPDLAVTNRASDTVSVLLYNPDNALTLVVPGTQTGFEDVDLAISGVSVDDDTDNLAIVLQVDDGTLSLGTTTGLTVTGNGTGRIDISGSIDNLNDALDGLLYRGNLNYSGSDLLQVTVNNGSLAATTNVALTVKSTFEQADDLSAQVDALVSDGVLTTRQGKSLKRNLDLKGSTARQANQIVGFMDEINALLSAGDLDEDTAGGLLEAANTLLDSITID